MQSDLLTWRYNNETIILFKQFVILVIIAFNISYLLLTLKPCLYTLLLSSSVHVHLASPYDCGEACRTTMRSNTAIYAVSV